MYEIYFYESKDGHSPIFEYIQNLAKRSDKNSRINSDKINDYIQLLSEHGKAIGKPYIKHICDDIWELRPIRIRIFFANWTDSGFILLHHFTKKTKRTPRHEIEQAKRNLKDMQKRSEQQ